MTYRSDRLGWDDELENEHGYSKSKTVRTVGHHCPWTSVAPAASLDRTVATDSVDGRCPNVRRALGTTAYHVPRLGRLRRCSSRASTSHARCGAIASPLGSACSVRLALDYSSDGLRTSHSSTWPIVCRRMPRKDEGLLLSITIKPQPVPRHWTMSPMRSSSKRSIGRNDRSVISFFICIVPSGLGSPARPPPPSLGLTSGSIEKVFLDVLTPESNEGAATSSPQSEMRDLPLRSLVVDRANGDLQPLGDFSGVE